MKTRPMGVRYRDYLKGNLPRPPLARPWSPYTPTQVADALEMLATDVEHASVSKAKWYRGMAAWVRRTGHFTREMLSTAMSVLVTRCSVGDCGKTALYRRGGEGRCRQHRDVPNTTTNNRNTRLRSRDALQARDTTYYESRERGRASLKRCKARRRK